MGDAGSGGSGVGAVDGLSSVEGFLFAWNGTCSFRADVLGTHGETGLLPRVQKRVTFVGLHFIQSSIEGSARVDLTPETLFICFHLLLALSGLLLIVSCPVRTGGHRVPLFLRLAH